MSNPTRADGSQLAPSRELEVDGKSIRVFDGHLPDVGLYVTTLSAAAYTRNEIAKPETSQFRHWTTEVRLKSLVQQPLFELTKRAVKCFIKPGHGYRPYRAYTNVSNFGDVIFTHTDCAVDEGGLTALWYMCNQWEIDWGGETVFYDETGEIGAAVKPAPRRLVVFDGEIQHVGRPPMRNCFETRYTFAIKFERLRLPTP